MIFMPVKESRFFVSEIFENLSPNDPRYEHIIKYTIFNYCDYVKLFENVNNERAIGEAGTLYLYYYKTAISKIKKYLGNSRIIIILRNPTDRAFSAYMHLLRDRAETLSFEKCLEKEEERIKENWSMLNFYKNAGFYFKQVKAYIENFDRVRVYLYEDLRLNASGLVKDMYEFLEVDASFVPNTGVKYNISGIPKIKSLYNFLAEPHLLKKLAKPLLNIILPDEKIGDLVEYFKGKSLHKPEMEDKTRKILIESYRDDILMLQDLIGRDLSHWLK